MFETLLNIWHIYNSLPKNKHEFNLYLKSRVKYATYCMFSFLIMIWGSLRMTRNWQMFWKETRCNRMLVFFGSLCVPSRHWKHIVVGCKRVCPSYFVCFIFYFCFSARKNKGCRNCRHWKEIGRKKERNRQKHFWGNSYISSGQLSFLAICVYSFGCGCTNSILCIRIYLVCLKAQSLIPGLLQVGII